jgi:hypothetical protein
VRGARHYRPDVPTRLKKCSEHIGDDCTDCCSVTPCAYCLELEIYGEDIVYGHAPESDKHWTGTVGGYSFDAYWERNYETDECEFVVELDGEEVYRKSCYEGQSCRDSSDEVEVTVGYPPEDATLRWIKHEPLPLEHVTDDETGCKTTFCDDCECSCECLCVTITNGYGCDTISGEICNVSYPCDGPVWEGTVGDYDLSIALGRDEYGECIITPSVDGVELDSVAAPGCGDMEATFLLEDGTLISVTCKKCISCDTDDCVTGCCWPVIYTELYPCGYRVQIPFEISAPGCVGLDGHTDSFGGVGVQGNGSCGSCDVGSGVDLPSVVGIRRLETGPFCTITPCTVPLAIILVCEDGAATNGQPECCGGFRLWVGSTQRFAGYSDTSPNGGDPSLYWHKYAPTSCGCGPLAMIFEVALIVDCPETWGGACAGLPKNCCEPQCGGFTLTI